MILGTIIKIALGLAGLGIMVFVHELGHFIAARASGITVEAFSIGWGHPILKKTVGGVEYRLGMFLILGGYCKMKGETDFEAAWNERKNGGKGDPSTFYGAPFYKRILTAFAGPFFNFVFAVVVLSFIWGAGIDIETFENRIVLLRDIDGGTYPSDQCGLESGDRITAIDGKKIETYRDLQKTIGLNPEKELQVAVERNGLPVSLAVTPALDKSGAGKIGVYYWADPVVRSVAPGSAAEKAGIQAGDVVTAVDGVPLPYTIALLKIFSPGGTESAEEIQEGIAFPVEYRRGGGIFSTELNDVKIENSWPDMGIEFQHLDYRTPPLSPPLALARGVQEAAETLAVSVKGLGLLFRGVDLNQAVSGPARITYMVGDVAVQGFHESPATGFRYAMNFLALISIALCIMNLLPLPILDGGLIVLALVEGIRGKPLHPKFISAFQTVGFVLIAGLMIFSLFNDILFFAGR